MLRLLIHGSAADATTFAPLVRALEPPCVTFDRSGADGSLVSVAEHAADAAAHLGDDPALLVGSSFGGVIALELARQQPERIAGVVVMEPPAPADPLSPAIPPGFGCLFDAAGAFADGEFAAEVFVRTVLGDETFERIPLPFRARILGHWRAIRSDMRSLCDYRFERLAEVATPVLILRGARSPARFEHSITAVMRTLPEARCATIARAGHMMHIEAAGRVATEIERFAKERCGR